MVSAFRNGLYAFYKLHGLIAIYTSLFRKRPYDILI